MARDADRREAGALRLRGRGAGVRQGGASPRRTRRAGHRAAGRAPGRRARGRHRAPPGRAQAARRIHGLRPGVAARAAARGGRGDPRGASQDLARGLAAPDRPGSTRIVTGERARRPALVRAAGCHPVARMVPTGQEIGLVHRQRHDDWSLPKGKLERAESWPGCGRPRGPRGDGLRTVVLGPPLPTQHYVVDGAPKEVRYWAAEARPAVAEEGSRRTTRSTGATGSPSDDGPGADSAIPTTPRSSTPSCACSEAIDGARADVLVVLRHARAMKRAHWRGPDDERPLEDRGVLEAEALAACSLRTAIDDVRSSGDAAVPGHRRAVRPGAPPAGRDRAARLGARAPPQAGRCRVAA